MGGKLTSLGCEERDVLGPGPASVTALVVAHLKFLQKTVVMLAARRVVEAADEHA